MKKKQSLHDLPRFDDKLTYLYVEHAVIEQQDAAIAVHRADGTSTAIPAAALAVLSRLLPSDVTGYQPYWVTLARAEAAAGKHGSAFQSLERAIGLTEDPAVRAFLRTVLPSR